MLFFRCHAVLPYLFEHSYVGQEGSGCIEEFCRAGEEALEKEAVRREEEEARREWIAKVRSKMMKKKQQQAAASPSASASSSAGAGGRAGEGD